MATFRHAALPRVTRRRAKLAAELLALAACLGWCLSSLPCAAAAASSVLRAAAAFAAQRCLFLGANAFVIALLAFCHREVASHPLPSGALLGWWSSYCDAQDRYLPSPAPPLTPPPPIAEAGEAAEEEKAVFEDKQAVHVTTAARAQPPRRSRSAKAAGGGGAAGRKRAAAAPELRRGESENGRQRRQAAAAAAEPEASPAESGMGDEEAFRGWIEAYIAKQKTTFQREESAAAAATATAAGEDAAPVTAGAVVAIGV